MNYASGQAPQLGDIVSSTIVQEDPNLQTVYTYSAVVTAIGTDKVTVKFAANGAVPGAAILQRVVADPSWFSLLYRA